MPAYNFQEQFAWKVHSFKKRQTIRRKRKRPTVVGDRLYLYTGMRTKSCTKLSEASCVKVEDVQIDGGGIRLGGKRRYLKAWTATRFAQADGFRNLSEMIQWFSLMYGLPFKGEVIYW